MSKTHISNSYYLLQLLPNSDYLAVSLQPLEEDSLLPNKKDRRHYVNVEEFEYLGVAKVIESTWLDGEVIRNFEYNEVVAVKFCDGFEILNEFGDFVGMIKKGDDAEEYVRRAHGDSYKLVTAPCV